MSTVPEYHISCLENQSGLLSRDCNLEVDHLVVYVDGGDPKRILPKELRFGFTNCLVRRTEQGVVARIIFFENIYLEIVFIKDVTIAARRAALPGMNSLMCAHWQQTTASPFELSLRYKTGSSVPTRFRKYGVEWIWSDASVYYAADNLAALEEPMCFILPDSLGLNTWLDPSLKIHRTLITHPLGVRRITDVAITGRMENKLSSATSMISRSKIVTIKHGILPLLELTLDSGSTDRIIDARPHLPILFRY